MTQYIYEFVFISSKGINLNYTFLYHFIGKFDSNLIYKVCKMLLKLIKDNSINLFIFFLLKRSPEYTCNAYQKWSWWLEIIVNSILNNILDKLHELIRWRQYTPKNPSHALYFYFVTRIKYRYMFTVLENIL